MEMDGRHQELLTHRSLNRALKLIASGLYILLVIIVPESALSDSFECGINRFNNESPLTERIVGGNNSLQ